MTDMEIGAFPFTVKKGKLMIMIITNCSGRAWILPKGQPESDKKDAQVKASQSQIRRMHRLHTWRHLKKPAW